MLAFAVDNSPPATVILISGDRDYAYAMSTLRLRNYTVILITPNTTACLEAQASAVVDWSVALTRSRVEPNSESIIRRPYTDLDASLFTKFSREITQLGDDDLTVYSVSPPSEGSSKSRRTNSQDASRPSFTKDDGIDKANNTCERTLNQGPLEAPPRCFNISDDPSTSVASASKAPDESRCSTVSTPALSRARSATVHSVTATKPDKGPVHRPTGSLPAPSDASIRMPQGVDISMLPVPADRGLPDAGNDGLSDCDRTPSILIGSPAKPPPTNSFIHSPPPLLNPRLNLTSTIPIPSSNTRTISGGTPISFGDPFQKAFAPAKPLATPEVDQKVTPVPTLNPFASNFISNSDADLMQALGLSDDDHGSTNVCSTGGAAGGLYDNANLPKAVSSNSSVTTSAANTINYPSVPPMKLPFLEERSSPAVSSEGAQLDPEGFSHYGAFCTDQTSDLSSGSPAPAVNTTQLSSQNIYTGGAPQNEASRQQLRTMFQPLIQRLLADRSNGILRSSRTEVAVAVLEFDKDAYKRVGVTKFKSYTQLAQSAGLVLLGGPSSNSWIALHPDWLDESDLGASRRETEDNLPVTDGRVSTSAIDARAGCFQPLVSVLVQLRQSGVEKALRSQVGQMMKPKVYLDAGVTGFKEYVARAVEVHVVQCGGDSGHAWISLHPNLQV